MLLSICIPTKNRAKTLFQSLESLVSQPIFFEGNDIEIIISDNASTDNTAEVAKAFVYKFPEKIKYYKNEIDLGDENFEMALKFGSGELLKLANDSLQWLPGSLSMMIELVKSTIQSKTPIFFLNQSRQTSSLISPFKDMDQLLNTCSYYLTWIGGYSIWKSSFENLDNFSRFKNLKLIQLDAFLRVVEKNNSGIICNIQFAKIFNIGRKGGYSIAEVFGQNYLKILSEFKGFISEDVMTVAKKDVFENHIVPFYFSDDHDFGKIDIVSELPEYSNEPYFKEILLYAANKRKNLRQKNLIQQAPNRWRELNRHNETIISNVFNFDRVTVGKSTYGMLNIHQWGNDQEFLEIGHYVSIADNVTFLMGGNHEYRGISTFPVKVKMLGYQREALTKGRIKIGDDVWIGHNVLILSGVQVGQGAVIAAGSVVAKDIPPYSIVGGNPAKIIKYRFPEFIIKEMLKINYEKINPEHLAELGESLYENCDSPVFHDSLSKLIEISKN
jgi:acetyltransferase-like isoleucine patch superfamily enzyme